MCVAVAVAAVTLAASAVAQSAPSQVPAAVVLETKTARSVDSAGESQPEPYSAHWRDQDGELCEAVGAAVGGRPQTHGQHLDVTPRVVVVLLWRRCAWWKRQSRRPSTQCSAAIRYADVVDNLLLKG